MGSAPVSLSLMHNLGSTLHVTPGVKIKTELFTPFLPKRMSRKELGDNGKEKT